MKAESILNRLRGINPHDSKELLSLSITALQLYLKEGEENKKLYHVFRITSSAYSNSYKERQQELLALNEGEPEEGGI